MHRIDDATAAVALPTPATPGTPGYFTEGNPSLAVPATIVTADWANAIQEEIAYVIEQAGGTLDKADTTQLKDAIDTMISTAAGSAASQAEMETGTATDKYSSPGRQKYHPLHIKKIVRFAGRNTDGTCTVDVNIGGTARAERVGTGYYRVLWSSSGSGDDMSGGAYNIVAFAHDGSAPTTVGAWNAAISSTESNIALVGCTAMDSTGVVLKCEGSNSGAVRDPDYITVIVMGDLP